MRRIGHRSRRLDRHRRRWAASASIATGAVIHELAGPAVTSAWSRIWRPLRQALPDACYAGGKALTGVEQHADGVDRHLRRRRARPRPICWSPPTACIRRCAAQLLPDLAPRYAGYVAWRGVVEAAPAGAGAARSDVHRMVFGFPDGELLLSIPMPAPQRRRTSRRALPFRLVSAGRRKRARRPLHRCRAAAAMASRSRRR